MAIKSIIADAVGAYLSQKIINGGLLALSGKEEGGFPKWLTSIIVPKSPVGPGIEDGDFVFDSPLKLTTLGFGIGFAGFLWYASREMDRAQFSGADQMQFDLSQKSMEPRIEISYIGKDIEDSRWGINLVNAEEDWSDETTAASHAHQRAEMMAADMERKGKERPEIIWLHHYDTAGHVIDNEGNIIHLGKEMSEFREPEQPELFKAKRTLTLEMEDIAKSDDPLFACMERRGYKQREMDRLSDSIAMKATIDIFEKKPEKLTSSETKFQDDIQSCIETITKVFGSLEAAGYEDCDCA